MSPLDTDIIIYQAEDGTTVRVSLKSPEWLKSPDSNTTQIDVRFEDETVWLTQAQLVDLFQSSKSNISEHITHIFEEGELDEKRVVRKFRTTASDGKSYKDTISDNAYLCKSDQWQVCKGAYRKGSYGNYKQI